MTVLAGESSGLTTGADAIGARPAENRLRRLDFGEVLQKAMLAAGPPLLFGLRLWASVSLALYIAFWLQLDNPYWAGTTAAIVCQPQLGASLRKGWFRMVGTLTGAVMSVVLVAAFPQDRVLFLGGLMLWSAACAFVATILRNFASYAAALAGYTVAIVAGDLLGATGGIDANAAFLLVVSRASEICLGIVCAGVIVAGSDLGGARRQLAVRFAGLSTRITAGLVDAFMMTGQDLAGVQTVRRELLRRVIGLDPVIDETLGESAQLRYHSPVLQSAVDGLFVALAGSRMVADHLVSAAGRHLRAATVPIINSIPPELRSAGLPGSPARWMADPIAVQRLCETAARRSSELSTTTPSLRLLADKTAEAFVGIAQALSGLALLVDPARPIPYRGSKQVRVSEWLPAFVSAGRAFVVIGAVALFWAVTGWPGGSGAITYAAIVVLLLGPRADAAYATALIFIAGVVLCLVLVATVEFAVLPDLGTESFAGFSLVIGLCLIPIGAMLAQARQPWQVGLFTGMTITFMPLLSPTNPMNYNSLIYYNSAMALLTGATVAALSFRLIPPPSPEFRTRRLLAVTLRDVRRLAGGLGYRNWDGRIQGRLVAMPDTATLLQRAQLLAAFSVGREIIHLRDGARRFDPCLGGDDLVTRVEAAFTALAHGASAIAIARLADLDAALAATVGGWTAETTLRTRAGILALTATLAEHVAFFDAGGSDEVH